MPTRDKAASLSKPTSNGILYNGGPVMDLPNGVNVYYIWYGNWAGNTAKPILINLAQELGHSPYFNINTTYFDIDTAVGWAGEKGPVGTKDFVLNKVNFRGSAVDNYSLGGSLSDLDVAIIIGNHMGVDLPIDENGVYFVLTSADVKQAEFGINFCAWHTSATGFGGLIGNKGIKIAWAGDPTTQWPAQCQVQDPSPNKNPGADSIASFIAHELGESVTDPDLNAWYDINGNENGDLCVWTFGQGGFSLTGLPVLPNGSSYNMRLGKDQYLIQRNWVNAKGGFCALQWGT
jgi:Phosphate-induced protein 1 conserved region